MTGKRAADDGGRGKMIDGRHARIWWEFAESTVRDHRDLLNAMNVFPVADSDTGTNVVHTLAAVAEAVRPLPDASAGSVAAVAASAAAAGARGNSGILLSLFLAGLADRWSPDEPTGDLAGGLRSAAERMRAGLARPVDGTILSIAEAAADGAQRPDGSVEAALRSAGEALQAGPQHLAVLADAGVLDSGGLALILVLEALAAALADAPEKMCAGTDTCAHRAGMTIDRHVACAAGPDGSSAAHYEVMFRVDADGTPVDDLLAALDRLGDSVVVTPDGAGAHRAHVHTGHPGEAVEAAMRIGAVTNMHIEVLPATTTTGGAGAASEPVSTTVLAFVVGAGSARLFAAAGAVPYRLDRRDGLSEVVHLLDRHPADRVLILPNGLLGTDRVGRVAELVRSRGAEVDLLWSATAVQGLAALSVRDPHLAAPEEIYAMSAAVAGTRWGTVVRSRSRVLTGIGMAEAGELLARLGVEVVAIGWDPVLVICRLLDRFLDTGGEVVTVLSGLTAPTGLEDGLRRHLETRHPGVELTVLDGGLPEDMVSVGVE